MTMQEVKWAQQHDWFKSYYKNDHGTYSVWVTENNKVHPWPFTKYDELRAWAGY
jgi:hypothetical protein